MTNFVTCCKFIKKGLIKQENSSAPIGNEEFSRIVGNIYAQTWLKPENVVVTSDTDPDLKKFLKKIAKNITTAKITFPENPKPKPPCIVPKEDPKPIDDYETTERLVLSKTQKSVQSVLVVSDPSKPKRQKTDFNESEIKGEVVSDGETYGPALSSDYISVKVESAATDERREMDTVTDAALNVNEQMAGDEIESKCNTCLEGTNNHSNTTTQCSSGKFCKSVKVVLNNEEKTSHCRSEFSSHSDSFVFPVGVETCDLLSCSQLNSFSSAVASARFQNNSCVEDGDAVNQKSSTSNSLDDFHVDKSDGNSTTTEMGSAHTNVNKVQANEDSAKASNYSAKDVNASDVNVITSSTITTNEINESKQSVNEPPESEVSQTKLSQEFTKASESAEIKIEPNGSTVEANSQIYRNKSPSNDDKDKKHKSKKTKKEKKKKEKRDKKEKHSKRSRSPSLSREKKHDKETSSKTSPLRDQQSSSKCSSESTKLRRSERGPSLKLENYDPLDPAPARNAFPLPVGMDEGEIVSDHSDKDSDFCGGADLSSFVETSPDQFSNIVSSINKFYSTAVVDVDDLINSETLVDTNSDEEDLDLKDSDNLLIAGKVESEGDVCGLDVYVYNRDDEELFVHHDYFLPAFPLAIEWMDYNAQAPNRKGNLVAVGSVKSEIEIWPVDNIGTIQPYSKLGAPRGLLSNNRIAETLNGHSAAVTTLSWNKIIRKGLASGSVDETVAFWDLEKGDCLAVFNHHEKEVTSVVFHPVEPYLLATGGFDKKVALLDLSTQESSSFWDLSANVECVLWSALSVNQFYVAQSNGNISCIDLRYPNKVFYEFKAHEKGVTALVEDKFYPGGLVSVGADSHLKLWNLTDHSPVCVKDKNMKMGHLSCVDSCYTSPFVYAVGGQSCGVRIVDFSNKALSQFVDYTDFDEFSY